MTDIGLATQELQRWGMNATQPLNDGSCRILYDVMTRNYPCMKQGICSPYSDTTIVIISIVVIGLAVLAGWYLHQKVGLHE